MPDEFQYDVFLSHSSKDKEVVRDIAERLRKDGVKVWFDEWVLKPGDSIPAKIEEGLEHSRVLVLCMSANAFGSDWAQMESGTFRFRDPLNKMRRFLPLRLDDAPIKGSLAQFLYINWLPEDCEQEYAKLRDACTHPDNWPRIADGESGSAESANNCPRRGWRWLLYGIPLIAIAGVVMWMEFKHQPLDPVSHPVPVPPDFTVLRTLHILPKDRPLAIIAIFEFGRPRSYTEVASISSVDLLYGMSYSSLRNGKLEKLIADYCNESDSRFTLQFQEYQQKLADKDIKLISDESFQRLLKKAAGEDPAMVRIQNKTWNEDVWSVAVQECELIGVKTPLGKTVVVDTFVNSGKSLHAKFKADVISKLDGTPATGVSESQWIENYLGVRRKYFAEHRNVLLHQLAKRSEFYLEQVKAGNWDLTKPFTLQEYYIAD